MRDLRIGIAGGGLLGRLLAWQLVGRGARTAVFDTAPDAMARGAAGWTAAGMLSPLAELESGHAEVAALGVRSIAAWPRLLEGLPSPVEFRLAGSVLLAHAGDSGTAARVLSQITARLPATMSVERLCSNALREMEPDVHGAADAWLLAGEGQIHTVQAMTALARGAIDRGVAWHAGHHVQRVEPYRIDDHDFDHVFDVRGLGAQVASGFGERDQQGLRGVRGEIVWLHAPGVRLNRPLRLLHPRQRVYLVPRAGDVVVVGASEIESEDRSPISVRTLLGLLSAAHSVMPGLAEARLVHTETNLRPAWPDNLPRIDQQAGLTRINGLFRHGWLIAPALIEDALSAIDRHPAVTA